MLKLLTDMIVCVIFAQGTFFARLGEDLHELWERLTAVPTSAETVLCKAVYEAETQSFIFEENSGEIAPAGHFAKLMTLLLAQEAVERGELDYQTVVTVSAHANSMQGAQIWLDVGEKITVEELIKSITVGNANDACVALAEAVCDSEESFTERMNIRAASLGMEDTYFADCTGISEATVTTAHDLAVLCGEISKHEQLYPYMTTWLDCVRDGKAQLVNTNRLVRSYSGIIGIKACSLNGGNALAAAAKRDGMTVVTVILGSPDEDSRFAFAREQMNSAFAAMEVCTPQMPPEVTADVSVVRGEKQFCAVELENAAKILIPAGSSGKITAEYERVETVQAPVEKGTVIGSVSLILGEETVFRSDIRLAETVERLEYGEALKRLLLELLKM